MGDTPDNKYRPTRRQVLKDAVIASLLGAGCMSHFKEKPIALSGDPELTLKTRYQRAVENFEAALPKATRELAAIADTFSLTDLPLLMQGLDLEIIPPLPGKEGLMCISLKAKPERNFFLPASLKMMEALAEMEIVQKASVPTTQPGETSTTQPSLDYTNIAAKILNAYKKAQPNTLLKTNAESKGKILGEIIQKMAHAITNSNAPRVDDLQNDMGYIGLPPLSKDIKLQTYIMNPHLHEMQEKARMHQSLMSVVNSR